jgi:hypothetical protein
MGMRAKIFRWWLALAASALSAACGGGSATAPDSVSSKASTPVLSTWPTGITRLVVTSTEVAFEGRSFGNVGTYQKVRGKAYGELDPADPRNAVITDLALAPRNARGLVEYAMDFYILRPADPARGNHKLFYEANNRGSKLFGTLNQSTGGNDPSSSADGGQAFLLNQGYTLAWSGWDPSAPAGANNLTITLPVAHNADGSAITGPNYEYYVFDDPGNQVPPLTYPAANLDPAQATLTVRAHLTDQPQTIPASGWVYYGDSGFRLLPLGTAFQPDLIYEFTYPARDPIVGGIGFAATRDFVALLRHGRADDANAPNPLAGDVRRVLAYAVSQPARYLNDFVWLGFNEDERGGKVFDAILNWLGAGTGIGLNDRFGQPSRTERLRMNHLYPEGRFPFAWTSTTDALTGKTDGRLRRCLLSDTCPRVMVVNSASEYWAKTASLTHTDPQGQDLDDPEQVRFYMLAGVEHTQVGSPANSPGVCMQPRSTVDATPALRALFMALDQWLDGVAPPPSAVPRRSEGTAVFSETPAAPSQGVGVVRQAALGWPAIPGVSYTGVVTVRELLDFGPLFDSGILGWQPPKSTGKFYPSFVSRVDIDGNELAGIRLPPVAVPTATFTGWGLRAPARGGPDGCEGFGQTITLASGAAQRQQSGDPRLSVSERWANRNAYVNAVSAAAAALRDRRLLLQADVDAYVAAARGNPLFGP